MMYPLRVRFLNGAALLGLVVCCAASVAWGQEYTPEERSHWSLKPRAERPVPQLESEEDRRWVRTPVDAFIREKQRQLNLQPAPPADRRTLVRRLYFDLLGLPPTPDEVAAFVNDDRQDAYEQLVERLLANPHYGERWAQHWLDVVRFAETEGFEYDHHRPDAWRYRDYVIQSLNEDKPYNQFLREQLAGDELARQMKEAGQTDLAAQHQAYVAAGFLRLGAVRRNAGNQAVAASRNEVLTEMTDSIGAAFLGLTVGCARCHDHMFDPIRQRDYYRLQAFLAATFEHDEPLTTPAEQAAWEAEKKRAQAEFDALKAKLIACNNLPNCPEEAALRDSLKQAEAKIPPPLASLFTVQNAGPQRTAIHVLKRGEWEQKGALVGPRPLGVLAPREMPELAADAPFPRTVLADWLTQPDHPLTARVMVNRLWLFHFGQGLVGTANDFGLNGDRPTHPELLDYLATHFLEHGWKFKPVHRLIVLSNTYRQSSTTAVENSGHQQDPHNSRLWHFPRRRLDAESLRDALLSISGQLNTKAGGPSIMVPVEEDLVKLLYKPAQWQAHADAAEHDRRSIYLIVKRNLRLPFLEVFDQPDRQTSCAARQATTHAPQALELLNGTLSNHLADSFAQRLQREAGDDRPRQISLAFQLAVGRDPSPAELKLCGDFLQTQPLREFALAVFNLNSFLYVD